MKRAIIGTSFLLLALASACHEKGGVAPPSGPPDASAPTASATVPARPPRPPARPGELLADLEASTITVAVVKDKDAAHPVVATVHLRDGRLTLGGAAPSATVVADLLTLDTRIPLRSERVRKIFFETETHGNDTLELTVSALPAAALAALRKDRRVSGVKLEGEVRVHGGRSKLAMVVDAAYAEDGALSVKTSTPVEMRISGLGLTDNLHHLSRICMHDSIDDVVKIEVALRFPPG